jgi:hypothetical protein
MVTACADPLGVRFDPTVPYDQRTLMQDDLSRVASLPLGAPTQNDLAYLSLGAATGPALADWIDNRMDIVVGENFDYDSRATLYGANRYSASSATTVMMNLGSYLYLDGKTQGGSYVINVLGQYLPVTSPRINILQIGIGLFTVNAISGLPLTAHANSILRIATYVHEGRHSDGNGSNAGFPHSMCYSGDYAGNYACENNVNGPYAVQTIFLKLAIAACSSCSQTENAGLQLSLADYASRQIGYQYNDPTPEGHL